MNPNKNIKKGEMPKVHNASTYTNWGCRCEKCKKAWRKSVRDRRFVRRDLLLADPTLAEHGKATTYENWMCRCVPCTQAHADRRWVLAQRKRMKRLAEEALVVENEEDAG